MHALLESIRKHPAMYLGPNNTSLTALGTFLTGYQCGYWEGSPKKPPARPPSDACLIPFGFGRFVAEHYGHKGPNDDCRWEHFVHEHADSDQAAFRLFFELLAEYDRRQQTQRAYHAMQRM